MIVTCTFVFWIVQFTKFTWMSGESDEWQNTVIFTGIYLHFASFLLQRNIKHGIEKAKINKLCLGEKAGTASDYMLTRLVDYLWF